MFMYLLFDLCVDSGFLSVFLILKYAFNIICIILPLVIIYRCISPLFKAVLSGKEFSGEFAGIVKSIIAALLVFLLPSLFEFVFIDLIGYEDGFSKCVFNANIDFINDLKQAEADGRSNELLKNREEMYAANEERKKLEKEKNDKIKAEREEKKKQEQQSSNNGSSSPGSSGTSLKSAAKNIIIGDSRTVGMCATKTGDWSKCQFSNGGAFVTGDDIYIAQGSKGFSWFNSTAVLAVNNILSANPDTTYNIYSLMGVNFLLSDIDKYIPRYKELASNNWNKHNLILVSVNPVDEVKESQNGYSTKNSDIITFNNKLKFGTSGVSNIKYCDTYNSVLNGLSTSDGLHYNSSTYNAIYSSMKSCGS